MVALLQAPLHRSPSQALDRALDQSGDINQKGRVSKQTMNTSDITFSTISPRRRERIRLQRKRIQQKKSLRQVLIAALVCTALSTGVALAWTHSASLTAFFASGQTRNAELPSVPSSSASAQTLTYTHSPFEAARPLAELESTGLLQLINRDHAINNMPLRSDMADAFPTLPVANQSIGVRQDALAATADMLEGAQAAGIGPFHIISGFRDRVRQSILYDEIADSSLVQQSGHSEHHTGLALDIVPTNLVQEAAPLNEQLDGTSAEEQWLAENSWRFGLILRYPEGSQAITGIAFEPWHFRYVGQVHAWYMWQHDLTLEEYLQLLEEKGGFDVTIGKRSYSIRYATGADGVVYVPKDKDFTLSCDNRGGYIITAWEQTG